jgi:predicted alpha-1,2-mannosidase
MRILSSFLIYITIGLFFFSCSHKKEYRYIQYVNPFIGTGGHGHTFPGATLPFGMVQVSPDTRLEGWDGCSGYHYSDSVIYGFTHTHLSGTGVSDYGDILLMPTTGKVQVMSGTPDDNFDGYASSFSHKFETASPGYYNVTLLKYKIQAELTATKRVGIHRYSYPKESKQNLIIDLNHRDKVLDSYIHFVSENEVEGYRFSSAWAKNQKLFFVMRFSKPYINRGIVVDDIHYINQPSAKGTNIRAFVNFSGSDDTTLMVKVGISFVDMDGARKNLDEEASSWDFEKYKTQAAEIWENTLSKISIDADKSTKDIFYTALYHSYIQPNIFNDVDKRYRGRDDKIHILSKGNYYTVFSLWDTYRAWHPLMTILEPQATNDFINTFLLQYEQSGLLPIWELAANETNCMIGYHAVSVIYDAWQKGIRDFNGFKALEAMKAMATRKIPSLENYEKHGCVLVSDDGESVSKTLEYSYDDWCIAQMAKSLGETDDYHKFILRSQYVKNLFDPQTKFFRARLNGSWVTPFSPYDVTFHYTEANAWQYTFYVPQNIRDFMSLLGGKDSLEHKLDSLFYTNLHISGREQSDITGLIGQYAHGNEPSHHIAYLYNFVGKPYKTQELINKIATFYTAKPDGLIGNEDCGQMSAWYVLSALGFYQVTPGDSIYIIGSPLVKSAIVNLAKPFNIIAHNLSPENKYIQRVTYDGKNYPQSYISHNMIVKGGKLEFFMGNKPSAWATKSEDCPMTSIPENDFVAMPYYVESLRSFAEKTKISFASIDTTNKIFYTVDRSEPDKNSTLYSTPFSIDSTCTIKAICMDKKGHKSNIAVIRLVKMEKGRKITILSKYSREYTGGGDMALIDGIMGSIDYRTGEWQGYQDEDLTAIIDLGKQMNISHLAAHFLQDVGSWILFPPVVEFGVSNNKSNFKEVAVMENTHPRKDWEPKTAFFEKDMKPINARYVKIVVRKPGDLPEWHPGAGSPAFFFIDEVVIK